jgi:molybdate transport system permease protein
LPLAKKGIIAGTVLTFARALGEFGATLMLAGNIPGKTDTMPLAIYTLASSGEWSRANFMVIFLTLISGLFLYVGNRFSRSMA